MIITAGGDSLLACLTRNCWGSEQIWHTIPGRGREFEWGEKWGESSVWVRWGLRRDMLSEKASLEFSLLIRHRQPLITAGGDSLLACLLSRVQKLDFPTTIYLVNCFLLCVSTISRKRIHLTPWWMSLECKSSTPCIIPTMNCSQW